MSETIAFLASGPTDWLMHMFDSLTWQRVLVGAAISIATFVASLVMVSFLLVKLPADFFHPSHDRDFLVGRHTAIRLAGMIIKNLLGMFLVVLGIIMSLPGVPGQGVLTILIGIILLDFPGKHALERKIVSRPKVLYTINRLRKRFDKPPLILD
jgi:hypothetical protein